MAPANSCMQCNNPTGSFSFFLSLPFGCYLPFSDGLQINPRIETDGPYTTLFCRCPPPSTSIKHALQYFLSRLSRHFVDFLWRNPTLCSHEINFHHKSIFVIREGRYLIKRRLPLNDLTVVGGINLLSVSFSCAKCENA